MSTTVQLPMALPSRVEELAESMRARLSDAPTSISIIGPMGTSADHACRRLLAAVGPSVDVEMRFEQSFDAVMARVLDGSSSYALVPSAYRGATSFHWHPELEFRGCFVHSTPKYGLASLDGTPGTDPVVLASMSEVEELFEQLAPHDVADRLERVVHADSTSHAASLVRRGLATVAVCNELGVAEHQLTWITHREGVPIVWMLFRRSVPTGDVR